MLVVDSPVDGFYDPDGRDAKQDETPVGFSQSPAIDDQSPMDVSSRGELEEPFTGNVTPGLDVENFPAMSQLSQLACPVDRMPLHFVSEGSYLFVLCTLNT
jgi:hypothetical protein